MAVELLETWLAQVSLLALVKYVICSVSTFRCAAVMYCEWKAVAHTSRSRNLEKIWIMVMTFMIRRIYGMSSPSVTVLSSAKCNEKLDKATHWLHYIPAAVYSMTMNTRLHQNLKLGSAALLAVNSWHPRNRVSSSIERGNNSLLNQVKIPNEICSGWSENDGQIQPEQTRGLPTQLPECESRI